MDANELASQSILSVIRLFFWQPPHHCRGGWGEEGPGLVRVVHGGADKRKQPGPKQTTKDSRNNEQRGMHELDGLDGELDRWLGRLSRPKVGGVIVINSLGHADVVCTE